MTDREKLDEAWDNVHYTYDIERRIKDMISTLVEFLIVSLLEQEDIEIGLLHNNQGSMVAYDIYNTDKILELRYRNDTTFELHVALEDEDGNLKSFYNTLSEKQISIIPEGLQMLMKSAYDKGEEMEWRPDTISK